MSYVCRLCVFVSHGWTIYYRLWHRSCLSKHIRRKRRSQADCRHFSVGPPYNINDWWTQRISYCYRFSYVQQKVFSVRLWMSVRYSEASMCYSVCSRRLDYHHCSPCGQGALATITFQRNFQHRQCMASVVLWFVTRTRQYSQLRWPATLLPSNCLLWHCWFVVNPSPF